MGIRIGIGSLKIGQGSTGVDWSSYWTTQNTAELIDYTAGLAVDLSSAQKLRLTTLVKALKTGLGVANLSDALDIFYILANETAESSLRNLVKNAHHGTAVNSPAFVALEGFNSDGIASYIDTNYNPATEADNYLLDSATMAYYCRTALTAVGTHDPMGIINGSILILASSNGSLYYYVNQGGPDMAVGYSNEEHGLFVATRNSAAETTLYRNKTANAVNAAKSSTIPNGNMFLLAENQVGTGARRFYPGQLSMAFMGRGLSQAQVYSIVDAFEAYMDANNKGMILNDQEQLTYHILDSKDNKIFGWRESDDKLLYSVNSGVSFTELDFTNVETVKMGFIFANGNLLFCSNNKVYNSTDGLATINELTPLDENGDAYSPPAGNLNFSPLHRLDSQLFSGNNEVLCWGNYTTSTEPIVIWKSLNGTDCVMTYRFGLTYPHSARHIHSVAFNLADNKWYVCTGDQSVSHEVWWIKGEFATAASDGTWADVMEGSETNQTKSIGVDFEDNNIYWLSDQTVGIDLRGIWHSSIADIATPASHVRDVQLIREGMSLIIEDDRILFTIIEGGSIWSLFVYDRTTHTVTRHRIYATPAFSTPSPYTDMPLLRKGYGGNYILEIYNLVAGQIYNSVRFTI